MARHLCSGHAKMKLHWMWCHSYWTIGLMPPERKIDLAERLFLQHAEVEHHWRYAKTILHIACENGASLDVVALILSSWPDATRELDRFGRTPLHTAYLAQCLKSKNCVWLHTSSYSMHKGRTIRGNLSATQQLAGCLEGERSEWKNTSPQGIFRENTIGGYNLAVG
eukprot:14252405-Ditylum_brightwellii.AAC.1